MAKITYSSVYSTAETLLPEVVPLVKEVEEHPELGYEEFRAADLQRDFLARHGFRVQNPLTERPTAFAADYTASPAPEIPFAAFLTEYDALPELGHACGHHLIMGAGLLAALILAWRIPGTGEPGGLLSMGSHRVGHD